MNASRSLSDRPLFKKKKELMAPRAVACRVLVLCGTASICSARDNGVSNLQNPLNDGHYKQQPVQASTLGSVQLRLRTVHARIITARSLRRRPSCHCQNF
jgi:hypothetical protein